MAGLRKQVARVVATVMQPVDGRLVATITLTSDLIKTFDVVEDDANAEWIAGVLDAFGVSQWEQLVGRPHLREESRTAYVIRREADGPVVGFEHLPTEPGGRFMFPDVEAIEEDTTDE